MNKTTKDAESPFRIDLSDEEFSFLGRIAASFGQIEYCLDGMIKTLCGINNQILYDIFVEGKQFGPKVDLLRKVASEFADNILERKIDNACKALASIARERNHVIHGQWGTLLKERNGPAIGAAALSSKHPDKPVLAKRLPELLAATEHAARLLLDAMMELWPEFRPQLPLAFNFVAGPGPLQRKSDQRKRKDNPHYRHNRTGPLRPPPSSRG